MQSKHDLVALTVADLAEAVGFPIGLLVKIASNSDRYYSPTRTIRTKNGKLREIDEPKPLLRKILKKLNKFLHRFQCCSAVAHGGIPRRSSFTSARRHLGSSAIAIRDVTDCYPSVHPEKVFRKLKSLGFGDDTATILTGLMTCRGRIPQGANTSGALLNLFMWDNDDAVFDFCRPDVTFTRMADDHVFGGADPQRVDAAAAFLEARLADDGLSVSEKKKAENGFKVSPSRLNVHSIGVNHPSKTRIPRDVAAEHRAHAEKYLRGARVVSAESLPAVAARRRTLMGYINYSRQADLSQADHLDRMMIAGDQIVEAILNRKQVARTKKWWVKTKKLDRSIEIAQRWRSISDPKESSSKAKSATTVPVVGQLAP